MLIAIVNQSTLVSNTDLETIVSACQIQLNLHTLPAYNLSSAIVKFYADPKTIPGYAWVIYVINNNSSVPNALGYHEEENNGKIDGYIMCEPILSNGGTVLKFDPTNPGAYTISGTLSHEILEAVIDPYTTSYCDNGNISWCKEVADPVEQIGYPITVNGEKFYHILFTHLFSIKTPPRRLICPLTI